MGRPKTYTLPEVFNSTRVGFTFEFYSSKDLSFIVRDLSNLTMKTILVTNEVYHTPSYGNAVLVKEYEGDKPRYSLHLAQQEFNSALPIVRSTLKWISETAECTKDTVMRVNMSFDHSHLETPQSISQMTPHRLIMKFDEEYAYTRFPKQKDSPYCMKIKQLSPMNESIYTNDMVKNVTYIIGTPKKNYFGINFAEQTNGILEFNYIGGQNYAYQEKEAVELLEYYVIKTFQSLNETDYNKQETIELREMTDKFYKIQEAYYDPYVFTSLFPNITVAVNLRRDTQLLKSFWPKIRTTLFEMVINNKFEKGEFNYDSETGRFQVRGANLKCTTANNLDLIKCNISGVLEKCSLWTCEVKNARLDTCKIIKTSKISESYLKSVAVQKTNVISKCYVENTNEIIDCPIKESVIKFAGIGRYAKLDESTVIVLRQPKDMVVAKGIEVEELRDYKWIQKLSGNKQEGHVFGNEYIKKRFL